MLVTAVHAEVPTDTLRSMIYAYPTFHRADRGRAVQTGVSAACPARRADRWSERAGPDHPSGHGQRVRGRVRLDVLDGPDPPPSLGDAR